MGELANRFIACCRTIAGAECIDDLPLSAVKKKQEPSKADFFFQSRTIICEIKSLEADPTEKFFRYLDSEGVKFSPETEYPDLIGYIEARPNGEAIWQKAMSLATTSIQDGISSANKQIRATKEVFGVASADGLLVVLNGVSALLGPQLVISRIRDRLMKPNAEGTGPYHDQIRQVILFSENYMLDTPGEQTAAAIPIANGAVAERHGVFAFLPTLVEVWARCNDRTFAVRDISMHL